MAKYNMRNIISCENKGKDSRPIHIRIGMFILRWKNISFSIEENAVPVHHWVYWNLSYHDGYYMVHCDEPTAIAASKYSFEYDDQENNIFIFLSSFGYEIIVFTFNERKRTLVKVFSPYIKLSLSQDADMEKPYLYMVIIWFEDKTKLGEGCVST